MVEHQLRHRGVRDERVLDAMRRVPRHRFAPDASLEAAYGDHALPIGSGQTISQPYMVARMTELLAVEPGHRVLEVGVGSGYQTAVLLQMGAEVVGIERHGALADRARELLAELYPHARCRVRVGDGTRGCPEHAPYDRILVAAAAPRLPDALAQQLADGGRCVIPVGDRITQQLRIFEKRGEGVETADALGCRFVPLVGEQGWPEPDNA